MRDLDASQQDDRLTSDRKALTERRNRFRLSAMARRFGWRIARPKLDDPVDRGSYRLVDLTSNRVLLGEQFDASLEAIEEYLRQKGNLKKTPLEMEENAVRQLAALQEHSEFVMRGGRRR